MSEHRVVCIGHLCQEWHDIDPAALMELIESQRDAALESVQSLRAALDERDRQMAWALKSTRTKDVLRRQIRANEKARALGGKG